jgi:pimeloyl-ACP methyl ester carboxylesterase
VTQIVDRLDIRRFAVGGHSMGGAVATTIAAGQPHRVTHLILVDAAIYPRQGTAPLALRLARMPVVGEMVALLKPRWMVARTLRQTYADPSRLEESQVQRYHDLLRRAGNRAATLRRVRAATPPDPLPVKALQVPTLILWGKQDRWTPPADAMRLHHDVAGSELSMYDDAGHAPMEESPDRSAVDVRRFLLR